MKLETSNDHTLYIVSAVDKWEELNGNYYETSDGEIKEIVDYITGFLTENGYWG